MTGVLRGRLGAVGLKSAVFFYSLLMVRRYGPCTVGRVDELDGGLGAARRPAGRRRRIGFGARH